jgi:hypothetical protein
MTMSPENMTVRAGQQVLAPSIVIRRAVIRRVCIPKETGTEAAFNFEQGQSHLWLSDETREVLLSQARPQKTKQGLKTGEDAV